MFPLLSLPGPPAILAPVRFLRGTMFFGRHREQLGRNRALIPLGPSMKTIRITSGRGRRAFTLVELLVVIAILGILSGLTAAAIASAKAKARLAQCVNNLRQHGIALQNFVTQNGVYPLQMNLLWGQGKYKEHSTTWMGAIFPDQIDNVGGAGDRGVFDCPAAERPKNFPRNLSFADYGYSASGLIGAPTDLLLGIGGTGSRDDMYAPPVREGEIQRPSHLLAIGDGLHGWNSITADGYAGSGRISSTVERAGSSRRVQKRHGGRAVFVFCDGHVEAIPLQVLFGSTDAAALSLWNRDGEPHSERLGN
jgi:prepilin-type N-terminal cleavage/methylation domain-containing protein/prepilin-type processing-associated H-X9-DG protein